MVSFRYETHNFRSAKPVHKAKNSFSGTPEGILLVASFVSQQTPKRKTQALSLNGVKASVGRRMLVGDLNKSHFPWDDWSSTNSSFLYKWDKRRKFITQRPPRQTFHCSHGHSRVDMVLHRGPRHSKLSVHELKTRSDHRALTAHLSLSRTSTTLSSILYRS